jgi:hypothetical protein
MSGQTLSPKFSAELASNVYLIKDEFSRKGFLLKYKKIFDMDDAKMAQGKTGLVVRKPHVMAFFAEGIGDYKGEAFVAVKGTASLYDALTDLNTGLQTSHTGCSVHQGFYYAFDSILIELRKFVSGLKNVNAIHCIGHSLGGAVATLAADWIKASGLINSVKLYTFGSPRVGLEMFATKSTSRLTDKNIFRVYHQTDPVPLLPTWPFFHVPTPGLDYLVFSPLAIKPWEYHFMKHYIKSAEKFKAWNVIEHNRPKGHLDKTVEKWLQSDNFISLTANTLELLNAALLYVIKKVVHLTGIFLVSAAASTFTLLDRLAIFMAKAAKVSSDLSIWVYRLVKKMAKLIGIVVTEGTDLTVALIRVVFIRLFQKISDMVWKAGKEILM